MLHHVADDGTTSVTATATLPTSPSAVPSGRSVRLGRHRYPVVLPSRRDPRLQLAAIIVTLQVLGQTVLHFQLSIAQILISVLTCAVIEVVITLRRRRVLMWPASALLTGNGVAFILRVPGTRPGEWWSTRGWWIFLLTAAVSILSKHVVQRHGRHVFNPSNVGLVACFLVLGSARTEPQYLWWGQMSPGLAATLTVIVVGGLLLTRRVQMFWVALAFWLTFAAATAVVTGVGHCMVAPWHVGLVCGPRFWTVVVLSPEVLVFLFFMITDPRTAPETAPARLAYATTVGLIAAVCLAPQRTEFATKVAILLALTLVCGAAPAVRRLWPRMASLGIPRRAGALALACVSILACALLVTAARQGSPGPAAAAPRLAPSPVVVSTATVPPFDPSAYSTTIPITPVPVVEGPLPSITVTAAARASDPAVTADLARRIVTDVIGDLAGERQALATNDITLADEVDGQPRRADLLWAIHVHGLTGTTTVRDYRFTRVTIGLTRPAGGSQASPQLSLTMQGTVVVSEIDPFGIAHPQPSVPFRGTFLVTEALRYVIDGA